MAIVETVISRMPRPVREALIKHRELVKFAIVGGTTFIIDNAIYFTLAFTILHPKPTVAKILAIIVATIASYILNREWSFKNRGGRERHHEATLFFMVSGIGVGINAFPLYVVRNWFHVDPEHYSHVVVVISDFWWGSIVGMLMAMVFRWWAFRRFVFPQRNLSGPLGEATLLAEAEDRLATGDMRRPGFDTAGTAAAGEGDDPEEIGFSGHA